MAQVSVALINSALREYTKSKEGKEIMQSTVRKYREGGIKKTAAGSSLYTVEDLHDIALDLIKSLKIMAARLEVEGVFPRSVADHFDSLSVISMNELKNGKYEIDIAFEDDLSRDSLLHVGSNAHGTGVIPWQDRTGDGVDNIISLFNTGYSAKPVFGFWENAGIFTPSRTERPHLGFMEKELEEVKMRYNGVIENVELTWAY